MNFVSNIKLGVSQSRIINEATACLFLGCCYKLNRIRFGLRFNAQSISVRSDCPAGQHWPGNGTDTTCHNF